MSRQHLIEIVLALALTLAALLFAAFAVGAEQRTGIVVSDAWARPTIGQGRVTAAYMKLENVGGADDVLLSAKTPKAARVEIHETTMNDEGVMKMRPLSDGLPIPAGKSSMLKPGGAHAMIMGLDDQLPEGASLPLTLEFEKAGTIEVSVPVTAKAPGAADKDDAADAMDHHHHDH